MEPPEIFSAPQTLEKVHQSYQILIHDIEFSIIYLFFRYDLYSAYDYVLPARGKVLAKTDIQVSIFSFSLKYLIDNQGRISIGRYQATKLYCSSRVDMPSTNAALPNTSRWKCVPISFI
jgi:hypothetical protein